MGAVEVLYELAITAHARKPTEEYTKKIEHKKRGSNVIGPDGTPQRDYLKIVDDELYDQVEPTRISLVQGHEVTQAWGVPIMAMVEAMQWTRPPGNWVDGGG
jgi:hypothetical protein